MAYNPFKALAQSAANTFRAGVTQGEKDRAARRAAVTATATKAQTYEGDYLLTPDWASAPVGAVSTVADTDAPLPPRLYDSRAVEPRPKGMTLTLPQLGASMRLDRSMVTGTGAPDGSLTPDAQTGWSTQTKILVGLGIAAAVAVVVWKAWR